MLGDERGISPVIAAILLIAIAVGMASIAYIWVTQFQKGIQERSEQTAVEQVQKMYAEVKIDGVVPTGAGYSVVVRNTGGTVLTNIALYVRDMETGNEYLQPDRIEKLGPGQLDYIPIRTPLRKGRRYQFRVTTAEGVEDTYETVI